MSPAASVLGMPTGEFLIWLGVSGFLSLFGLWGGFRRLHHARLIENVPTAKVRSAHQGYVELVGTAEALPGEPVIAPLSGSVCCWYDYRIERRSGKHWNIVDKGTSEAVFAIRDDTGRCLIDPEAADSRSGTLRGGGVSERPKEHASKACEGATPPWVQIPPPPLPSATAPRPHRREAPFALVAGQHGRLGRAHQE